jgi:hypothetical protein
MMMKEVVITLSFLIFPMILERILLAKMVVPLGNGFTCVRPRITGNAITTNSPI